MKVIRKRIDSTKRGEITLKPMSNEDMWECYNIISKGDDVKVCFLSHS